MGRLGSHSHNVYYGTNRYQQVLTKKTKGSNTKAFWTPVYMGHKLSEIIFSLHFISHTFCFSTNGPPLYQSTILRPNDYCVDRKHRITRGFFSPQSRLYPVIVLHHDSAKAKCFLCEEKKCLTALLRTKENEFSLAICTDQQPTMSCNSHLKLFFGGNQDRVATLHIRSFSQVS